MNFDRYKNTLLFPERIRKICPSCAVSFSDKDNFCSTCGYNVGEYYKEKLEKYREEADRYDKEEGRLYNEFKHDSLDEVGLLNHPKANDIFSFAWEHGHSSGYYDVFYWLQEISELFKD